MTRNADDRARLTVFSGTSSRRTVVKGGAGLGLAAAFGLAGRKLSVAQDATPGATPEAVNPEDLLSEYGPVQGNENYTIAFMQPFPNLTFWQILQENIENRAAENGVTVEVFELSDANVSDQVAQMETAVAQGVSGIILGTIDAAGIITGIEAANAAGIPVLCVDTAPAGGEIISLVQTDNVNASRLGGEYIAELIDFEGQVLNLQGDLANQTAQARTQGIEEALAAYPDIELISQSSNWRGDLGQQITEDTLTANPDLKAIFAASDDPAFGALEAISAAGRDDVLIVGFDANPEAVEAVAEGLFAGEVAQFPNIMGTVGVDLMVRFLNGEDVPATLDSGSAVITPENVADFLPEE